MIDPLVLRNQLTDILGQLLGQYNLPSGKTAPAIATLPDPQMGWQYPPSGTKVTGLEVVIKLPYPEVQPNIGGDRTLSYTWEIHFKQWDTNKSVRVALEKTVSELSSSYRIERASFMPASEKILSVEQCKIYLQEWAVIGEP